MSRARLAILLFVCLLGGPVARPAPAPAALPSREGPQAVYFPILSHSSPVRVVVTVWNDNPYGYHYHTLGYLESKTGEAYEVTLEADVTVYPASLGTPEPPYTTTVQFEPALDVTLPGQRNPFSLDALQFKRREVITAVRVAQAIAWDGGRGAYVPLTVTRRSYRDGVLSGRVRNDGAQALDQARLVAASLYLCPWIEAVLETVSLQPGQETRFRIDPYSAYCMGEPLLLVGQGRAP